MHSSCGRLLRLEIICFILLVLHWNSYFTCLCGSVCVCVFINWRWHWKSEFFIYELEGWVGGSSEILMFYGLRIIPYIYVRPLKSCKKPGLTCNSQSFARLLFGSGFCSRAAYMQCSELEWSEKPVNRSRSTCNLTSPVWQNFSKCKHTFSQTKNGMV